MKKLMFILAAVIMVAGAHAASVYWTCTNVKDGSGNPINGIAYFINAASLSQDAFKALDGADAFTSALSGMYSYTPTSVGNDAGKYTVDTAHAVDNATLGLSDTTAYSVYLAVFDTATITDSSKYYLTEAKDLTTYSGTSSQSLKFGSQSTASQAAGAWSSVKASEPEPPIDSPEPTSGLLMIIGAAGLALRRKRA